MTNHSRNQYRIKLNGEYRAIVDEIPSETWTRLAQAFDSRGGIRAQLECRLITSPAIFEMIPDAKAQGYRQIDENTVVCPWEIIAELDDTPPNINLLPDVPAQQLDAFDGTAADLPLFSGTAPKGTTESYQPTEEPQQDSLFDLRPRM